jgi:nucleotide-binding universal stress UspA family protein
MKRILVAIDFSDVTDEVVSKAVLMCKALQGQIRVLHVDNSAPYVFSAQDPERPVSNLSKALDPAANEVLENIRDQLATEGITADFRQLEGPAGNNIVLAAREYEADLIVIGGHQHGHFYQCFFGTRTESVIRDAPCPILVVPPVTTF